MFQLGRISITVPDLFTGQTKMTSVISLVFSITLTTFFLVICERVKNTFSLLVFLLVLQENKIQSMITTPSLRQNAHHRGKKLQNPKTGGIQ